MSDQETALKGLSSGRPSKWWRGAVIYQIYPRSFKDSNGDGVGDLPGVLGGLDYIASLGVDGIWLSPFFKSPMNDFGYDISDYYEIDPVFGLLSDFDAIVAKAHDLGLRVIIDQVYSHTSNKHAWFEESRHSRDNNKADWYVWVDPKEDGSPPNNWQSVFGGPAWQWESRRQQYYLHNFLTSQPDLNLHNIEVQNAILAVARFWLERGVDGFRLDALNFAMHDPQLRDNPPAPKKNRQLTRPFDYQLHVYNQSHPGIVKFLERLRCLCDEFQDVFTVAEVVGEKPLNEMKAFTLGNTRLSSAYNFDFLYAKKLTSELTRSPLMAWQEENAEGWPSWAFSNHDAPRAVSRWASSDKRETAAKLYGMLLLCLRGNIFLYQGEELGLPQGNVPFEKLKDPEAIENWPLTLGRDGARTPMPWRKGAANAGFTTGTPWLPVDPHQEALSVDAQAEDKSSVLNFIRKFITIRSQSAALRLGSIEFCRDDKNLIYFFREYGQEKIHCIFNITDEKRPAPPSIINLPALATNLGYTSLMPNTLPPYSGFLFNKN